MTRKPFKLSDSIEIDWAILGARLANLSTDEQCPFFKQFAAEMLRYPSRYETEMQLHMIRDGMNNGNLTEEEKEVYELLSMKKEPA
jgi:hypothetical protein